MAGASNEAYEEQMPEEPEAIKAWIYPVKSTDPSDCYPLRFTIQSLFILEEAAHPIYKKETPRRGASWHRFVY
jgi:hypothetical protein